MKSQPKRFDLLEVVLIAGMAILVAYVITGNVMTERANNLRVFANDGLMERSLLTIP